MSQPLDGHQPRIFKVSKESGTTNSRNITSRNFSKSLTLTPLPNDVQRRTFPLLTQEEWRASLQEKVTKTGQTNPSDASLLSRKIIFYGETAREREELERLGGIQVPVNFYRERLLGGVLGEASALLAPLLKGAIKILVEGNKQAMKEQEREQFVDARVQLPNGDWIEGKHEGGRDVKKVRRFAIKRFSLAAFGYGKFISEKVKYEGDFYDNLFHDLTGKAEYFIDHETRYTGCFVQGKRAQHGVLEKYDPKTGEFYLYYRGTWKNDQPETGTFFSPKKKAYC